MATRVSSTQPEHSTLGIMVPALLCGLTAALLLLLVLRSPAIAAGFGGAALVAAGAVVTWHRLSPARVGVAPLVDWSVARALAAIPDEAIAVTDRAGRLVCANALYRDRFGGYPTPPGLPIGEPGVVALGDAGRAAWRDGASTIERMALPGGAALSVDVVRTGAEEDLLVWRFREQVEHGLAATVERLIAGPTGDRLASAGVMVALMTAEGRVVAANRVLRRRAMGYEEAAIAGRDFARLLMTDADGLVRFEREGLGGTPVRVIQMPFIEGDAAPVLIVLLDEELPVLTTGTTGAAADHVNNLVALLPVGIALVDRDGRFTQMNDTFRRAAQVDPANPPVYPGDLVVREDKASVADAVRRFASGAAHAFDMAVRLKDHPDEPVALTIAGARGLGEAAVLLSLKDNGEETRLKREVAQAMKMQAVGQLAGGLAHDFNNILTAVIGHCDLMLMRHTPGDSDYDDIQQVKSNSNRAAGLIRHMLAFSRQQTLRPQVLQLPDVISEVTNLLKRVLGESIVLSVSHGRDLGAIRADPVQLEQVVVNLAVNARDAIAARSPPGGGKLTIQTMSVHASEVRRTGQDILPIADYTALKVTDNGTGIPADILPKIFEPFFSTKEVGKGTGLGLSTVYGIVKQSGGYIFADSRPGHGTTFSIYLPVHSAGAPRALPAPIAPKERAADLWGNGTILLVEDEDMVRAVAERALVRQGYKVVTAEHGEAGLEKLATLDRPDLLITDVMMPVMDGPTMVRHARERYPDLPILFMSGYAEEQVRKSIDLEHMVFLPKPFSVQQLAEAARNILAPA